MRIPIFALALTLAACADSSGPASGSAQEQAVASASKPDNAAKPVAVSLPHLAYAYSLAYLVPGDRVAATQDDHRAACEAMGSGRCQLLALERGSGAEKSGSASLKLRVANSEARSFQDALGKSVSDAGGRALDTQVAAEDVSKALVDTEARIKQRELLVARLVDLLRTRHGTVAELVEAERSVTAAQEELEQARGWLAQLRSQVAMSEFDIRYDAIAPSASPQGLAGQLGEAAAGSGANFLIGLRALLTIAIYLAPWAVIGLPLAWLLRRRSRQDAALPQA